MKSFYFPSVEGETRSNQQAVKHISPPKYFFAATRVMWRVHVPKLPGSPRFLKEIMWFSLIKKETFYVYIECTLKTKSAMLQYGILQHLCTPT